MSTSKTHEMLAALEPRMLVVAPHADDEVLGAGGLMARAAADGWEVGSADEAGVSSDVISEMIDLINETPDR